MNQYVLVHTGTTKYILVQPGTYLYVLYMQVFLYVQYMEVYDTSILEVSYFQYDKYTPVHSSTYMYVHLHTGTYQYIPVHTKTYQGSEKVQTGLEPVILCMQWAYFPATL